MSDHHESMIHYSVEERVVEEAPKAPPAPPASTFFEKRIQEYISQHHPQIAILTPCYGGTVFTSYTESLIITMKFFEELGVPIRVYFCKNDSLVSRARNNLVAKAMSNPANTHFLFIDSDITWNPVDIAKLMVASKPIIGGAYPIKNYDWSKLLSGNPANPHNIDKVRQWIIKKTESPYLRHLTDEDMIQKCLVRYNVNYLSSQIQVENNVAAVRHIATGFMMIQRWVFDKMMMSYKATKYVDDVGFLTGDENQYAYALFDCGVEEGHYFSEDWMFCERWRNMGGEIFLDVSVDLDHTGIETYRGSFLVSTSM